VDRPSPPLASRPTLRQRLARRPYGPSFWVGVAILLAYLAAALSALVVFRQSLTVLPVNSAWIPSEPFAPAIGPSPAHPFGVLPGLGVDLFQALWQATPWDLAIVGGILAFDALLGWVLGAIAGLNEGGTLDALISWVGDTVGAIPSFFLVVGIFAGLSAVAPQGISLPLFVLLFGVIIWPSTARLTRDRARLVARQPYVEATRACGGSRRRILLRHILPGSVTPMLTQLPLDVAPIFFVLIVFPWFWDCASHSPKAGYGAIFVEPTLPPFSPLPSVGFPEWGNILAVGVCYGLPVSTGIVQAPVFWWMFLFPLLAILGLAFGIALVCDGLDRRFSRLGHF
jgi:peptide/nickel transport system permease protein